jgi:PadR family transcriptional regulator PadR
VSHTIIKKVILMDDVIERFEAEARRGLLQLAILFLTEKARYGYDIMKTLKEEGLAVEESTLYPILRRLEDDKLLSSHWETAGPRPRKYYAITEYGKEVRKNMLVSLKSFNAAIERMEKQTNGVV